VLDDIVVQATAQFLDNEFLKDDSVKFARLARGRSPVDSLSVATRGELGLRSCYREILAPMELEDELRVALVVGSNCWGFMCLHRVAPREIQPQLHASRGGLPGEAYTAPGRGSAHSPAHRRRTSNLPAAGGAGVGVARRRSLAGVIAASGRELAR
jgi:hypothetical protein